jgi:hypothetical protein
MDRQRNLQKRRYTPLDDALQPQGTLLRASDSAFYGVASGNDGIALVFKLDAQNFKIVAKLLENYGDGWGPYAVGSSGGLIESQSGVLYGTTTLGYVPFPDGSGIAYDSAHGAIFSLTKEGLNVQVNPFPFDLSGSSMSVPTGRLLLAKDGYIYGTEQWGENDNSGSIFRLSTDPASLNPTIIGYFGFPLLASGPQAGIAEDAEGMLYGTTSRSIGFRVGSDLNAVGSVFSFDATNGIINPLKVFHSVDGATPIGEVVFASDGGLYGTTSGGGEKSCGTIFGIFAKPQSLIEEITQNQDMIEIRARGTDSSTFILQASDSVAMGVWRDIATNSPTTSSVLAFSIPTNWPTRFFRVASQAK